MQFECNGFGGDGGSGGLGGIPGIVEIYELQGGSSIQTVRNSGMRGKNGRGGAAARSKMRKVVQEENVQSVPLLFFITLSGGTKLVDQHEDDVDDSCPVVDGTNGVDQNQNDILPQLFEYSPLPAVHAFLEFIAEQQSNALKRDSLVSLPEKICEQIACTPK